MILPQLRRRPEDVALRAACPASGCLRRGQGVVWPWLPLRRTNGEVVLAGSDTACVLRSQAAPFVAVSVCVIAQGPFRGSSRLSTGNARRLSLKELRSSRSGPYRTARPDSLCRCFAAGRAQPGIIATCGKPSTASCLHVPSVLLPFLLIYLICKCGINAARAPSCPALSSCTRAGRKLAAVCGLTCLPFSRAQ